MCTIIYIITLHYVHAPHQTENVPVVDAGTMISPKRDNYYYCYLEKSSLSSTQLISYAFLVRIWQGGGMILEGPLTTFVLISPYNDLKLAHAAGGKGPLESKAVC